MKHLPSNRILLSFCMLLLFGFMAPAVRAQESYDSEGHQQIVRYLQELKIIDNIESVTLWTTPFALDTTHVVRHMIREKGRDIPFPFGKSWLVMIDDNPEANFGHPVRWLFIDSEFRRHSGIMKEDFPPVVLSDYGDGKPVEFKCWDLTPHKCALDESIIPRVKLIPVRIRDCKYAVLVSGGINSSMNYSRYAQNIKSMYIMLRNAGYPKSHIFVYYASGNLKLDCDNEDGDNNDATGSDVTGGAIESDIRAKFQDLCSAGSSCHILFSYFTNHGADNTGVCLWDADGDGLESSELYSPSELSSDVANCKVCRHFMIHDQCYSGDFLPMATDGNHKNLVVYASASATEVSYGREYMARWEQNDITKTTVNAMHQDVVNNGNLTSTPGMAEGTAGVGNHLAGTCCLCWWWWKYWYVVVIVVVVIIGGALIFRRSG